MLPMDSDVSGYDDDLDDDDGMMDEDGYLNVGAAEQLTSLFKRAGKNPRKVVQTLARTRIQPQLANQVNPKVAATMSRMTQIARAIHDRLGIIDAYEQRRPNSLCCVYGTAVAPGGTLAFSITPSGGQSWYRLLAFLTGDDQAQVFGFTDLKVGGLSMIFATQTTPPAPVTNASAWYGFVARGDNQVFNLAPWTGQVFDNSVTVNGTIVNMTVAATGDAITLAPRFLIPVQTDPCGNYTSLYKAAGNNLSRNLSRASQLFR